VKWRDTLRRMLRFNSVGAIGIVVQLGMLALLRGVLHLHYLVATALAVETAVLHNFVWHELWTWRDRTSAGRGGVAGRLIRFHLGAGLVSILTNLGMMRLLVGRFHIGYMAANLLSIATGSLVNFLLSDRLVFAPAADRGACRAVTELPEAPVRNTVVPAPAARAPLSASTTEPRSPAPDS
jgi:putative flippase GtrA